jgi:hypothetical protein
VIIFAGASFALILEALCDHVYQQAQPAADAIPRHTPVSVVGAAAADSSDAANTSASCSVAHDSALLPAPLPPGDNHDKPLHTTTATSASSSGHGMVVDALASLPSIHARRSVVVDSNGATFSVDDIAARRLRKEQRRKKVQQEAEAAQTGTLAANVADEKPNAALPAAVQTWSDVPAEFCCALNGSLIKQPVLVPGPIACCSALCHVMFRCRSNPNTGILLTTHASSSGCSCTATPAPSRGSRCRQPTLFLTPPLRSGCIRGRYNRRCSSRGYLTTCTSSRLAVCFSKRIAGSGVVANVLSLSI